MLLDTPIIVIVSGEGGSGGALGIAVGDRVLMQEFAIYSVIPPEGLRGDSLARPGEEGRGRRGAEADGARSAEGRDHRRDHPGADRRRAHRSRRRRAARRRGARPRPRRGAQPSTARRASRGGTTSSGTWVGWGSISWTRVAEYPRRFHKALPRRTQRDTEDTDREAHSGPSDPSSDPFLQVRDVEVDQQADALATESSDTTAVAPREREAASRTALTSTITAVSSTTKSIAVSESEL